MVGIRRKTPTVPKKIYLSQETAGRIDLFLADPIRRKPKYAALSQLCEMLLVRYMDEMEQHSSTSPDKPKKEGQENDN